MDVCRDRTQPPSRSISVQFSESPTSPTYGRRASLIPSQPSTSRPSLHHRSASVGAATGSSLSRKQKIRRAFASPSPALSPTISETFLESPVPLSPVPEPSSVGAVTERSVVVVSGEEQAMEMHAQVGVWEEQSPTPGWAAYERAVASAGVWQHDSVGGPQKDPFAPAAPSYIAGPRPAMARGRRELAVDTLVSSNTAYIMASMAGSLDSDSADGSTLVGNSPVSASSPGGKRASVVSASPSTKTRFTSRLQRAMRKLRGVPPSPV